MIAKQYYKIKIKQHHCYNRYHNNMMLRCITVCHQDMDDMIQGSITLTAVTTVLILVGFLNILLFQRI